MIILGIAAAFTYENSNNVSVGVLMEYKKAVQSAKAMLANAFLLHRL